MLPYLPLRIAYRDAVRLSTADTGALLMTGRDASILVERDDGGSWVPAWVLGVGVVGRM